MTLFPLSPLSPARLRGVRLAGVSVAILLGGAVAACAPDPPYAHLPEPGQGRAVGEGAAGRAVVRDATEATTDLGAGPDSGGEAAPASGACGRLLALQDYQARLRDLIAAIEADGVTDAERTDLMRAYSRLHEAEAEAAAAARDVAGARYRLEALTGGSLKAHEMPACR
ncbi:hypothetical protein [Roseospira goensis]|uniref:Uncharacterized protein n=1 Tax=Roseospira goensis TaxID=391922 RepID=A0A7W6RX95_9PROT|nr:hypothetical protein [Roseospira goensis]MBB4284913.1 hypothetical protein [Roseospira goensis]